MRISEIYDQKRFIMSAEVFPPKKYGEFESLIRTIRDITPLRPDFVSVTYGAAGKTKETTADALSVVKDAFGLECVAHLTCVNMTVESLENIIAVYKRKNVENILVLRGDVAEDSAFYDFKHANELAAYIAANHPEFDLLGACYPEGHPEAISFDHDVDMHKQKIDSGVTHLVSQLFFDNSHFYNLLDAMQKKGITASVEAGIMPVVNKKSIQRLIKMCGTSIPHEFAKIFAKYDDDDFRRAGIEYTKKQISDLISNGVRAFHIYTMNNADVAAEIYSTFADVRREFNE